jgi:hypothetical protein
VTRVQIKERVAANRAKYGISDADADKIVVPRLGAAAGVSMAVPTSRAQIAQAEAKARAARLQAPQAKPEAVAGWRATLEAARAELARLEAKLPVLRARKEQTAGAGCPGCGTEWGDGFLLGCDRCGGWYHGACVNVAGKTDVKGERYWYCPPCEGARDLKRAAHDSGSAKRIKI